MSDKRYQTEKQMVSKKGKPLFGKVEEYWGYTNAPDEKSHVDTYYVTKYFLGIKIGSYIEQRKKSGLGKFNI